MKKLQIDIMGEAPSISEINAFNEANFKKSLVLIMVSVLAFVSSITFIEAIAMNLIAWLPAGGIVVLFAFSLIYSFCFIIIGVINFTNEECFVCSDVLVGLKELIKDFPEIALYRDKVVSQGRAFLQSEYEACVNFVEKSASKEIYGVNNGSLIGLDPFLDYTRDLK